MTDLNKFLLVMFMMVSVLSGCGLTAVDETLDIKSQQALNGVWVGTLSDYEETKQVAVRLELTATTINTRLYTVAGTMQLDNGEKLAVVGEVRAGKIPGIVKVGNPSIFEASASKRGEVPWELNAFRFHDDGIRWELSTAKPGDFLTEVYGTITRE